VEIIPHSRPTLGPDEIRTVSEVIASGYIIQGARVEAFEDAVAEKIGVKYAAAVSSGTAALHLTLIALGVGAGDEVIIPSFVCTALLNAVRYLRANPILADIEPGTYNIDPEDVKKRVSDKTKAIIVPHLFGISADLNRLTCFNIPVIEDCAQSIGCSYHGQMTGTFGKASIFSFYATKVFTTGEGGMVVTDSKDLIDRVRDLRDYDNKDEYTTRYNYKMTDIQAAMGIKQLSRLSDFIYRRREIAHRYSQSFQDYGIMIPQDYPGHIYFRYIIDAGENLDLWIEMLKKEDISCARPIFLPLHHYLKLTGYPETEKAWKRALSIPIYPSLNQSETDRVINGVLNAVNLTGNYG
jgi:perosamine synthetase